jgi:hypothetical protein
MNPANDNRQETSNVPSGALGLNLVSARDPISKIERPNMKTKITTIGRIAGLAVAVALFIVSAAAANAQEKGAAKLLQLTATKATSAAIVPDYKPISCANCKDSFVTVPDTEIKGAGARTLVTHGTPTRIVAKHLCGTCANEWVVKGHGKTATFLAVHTCSSCL